MPDGGKSGHDFSMRGLLQEEHVLHLRESVVGIVYTDCVDTLGIVSRAHLILLFLVQSA
jgi:hypothetical protein